MGLFSAKKKDGEEGSIPMPPAGLGIPRPPSMRHVDDFEKPFDIDRPISEQMSGSGMTTLVPTTLSPGPNVDLSLPSFTIGKKQNIDLDAMEKELSIAEKANTGSTAENKPAVQTDSTDFGAETKNADVFDEEPNNNPLDEDIEIPDTIDDIPDFIPELDVDSTLFNDTIETIEEPKEERAIFLDLGAIARIKEAAEEVKGSISELNTSIPPIFDNYRKERELLSRLASSFEDMERKILFVNKVLFSEG